MQPIKRQAVPVNQTNVMFPPSPTNFGPMYKFNQVN
jgi:hypothetical protein